MCFPNQTHNSHVLNFGWPFNRGLFLVFTNNYFLKNNAKSLVAVSLLLARGKGILFPGIPPLPVLHLV